MTLSKPSGGTRWSAEAVPALSDTDFATLAALIHRDTGIVIGATKRSMLISRLTRRLRQLSVPDFATYIRLLDAPEGEDERSALISAITTNVTGFYREPHHFEALVKMAPDLLARARSGARVRLWSAACSTGQEAFSMAAALLDAVPDIARHDLLILATDIDPKVIEQARSGTYDRAALGEAAPPVLRRFLVEGPEPGRIATSPALGALIRFEVLNLLAPWPFQGSFDVIFCRNVFIYFDDATRRSLLMRFAARLRPGGTLFLGHSERLDAALEPYFESVGWTEYLRTNKPIAETGPASGAQPNRRNQTQCR